MVTGVAHWLEVGHLQNVHDLLVNCCFPSLQSVRYNENCIGTATTYVYRQPHTILHAEQCMHAWESNRSYTVSINLVYMRVYNVCTSLTGRVGILTVKQHACTVDYYSQEISDDLKIQIQVWHSDTHTIERKSTFCNCSGYLLSLRGFPSNL